jgi:LysM repeat protein
MNNPNPFLPQGSFLEQKDKARRRVKIAVYFSISLSVVALMALLIQGCRKPNDTADTGTDTNSVPQLPTNPPDMNTASNTAMTPVPETNQPTTPPPAQPVFTPPPAPMSEDYTVIKGDTFDSIRKKSNVSLKALEEANPGVDPKKLKIGQKLHIPAPTSAPTPGVAPMAGATESTASGGEQTYKVKSGDNLTTIAKHFHVTIKAIQSANNMTTTSIKVGQTLKIPAGAAPAPAETMPPPVTAPSAPVPAGH